MQLMKFVLASALSSLALASTAQTNAPVWVEGEIIRIEKDSRIIIKHGELKNLGMSGTTSSFIPKDKSMGNALRAGAVIQFVATKEGDKLKVADWIPSN